MLPRPLALAHVTLRGDMTGKGWLGLVFTPCVRCLVSLVALASPKPVPLGSENFWLIVGPPFSWHQL